jgi:L-serine deaminase
VALRLAGAGRWHELAGRVDPGGALRLTAWDGLPLDIAPARYTLLTRHRDQPGRVGRVGTLLAPSGVTIAAMCLGRRQAHGAAVMVLARDEPVPPAVVAALRASPGFDGVHGLELAADLAGGGGDD